MEGATPTRGPCDAWGRTAPSRRPRGTATERHPELASVGGPESDDSRRGAAPAELQANQPRQEAGVGRGAQHQLDPGVGVRNWTDPAPLTRTPDRIRGPVT